MGDGRWEMGDGSWEMGDRRREIGDGTWEIGDGRWDGDWTAASSDRNMQKLRGARCESAHALSRAGHA